MYSTLNGRMDGHYKNYNLSIPDTLYTAITKNSLYSLSFNLNLAFNAGQKGKVMCKRKNAYGFHLEMDFNFKHMLLYNFWLSEFANNSPT